MARALTAGQPFEAAILDIKGLGASALDCARVCAAPGDRPTEWSAGRR